MGSKTGKPLSLFGPDWRERMPHEPLRCQSNRLTSVLDRADDVGSQEGQFYQLLNTAFRNAFVLGDLSEGFSGDYEIKVPVRPSDVAEEGRVDVTWIIAENKLCLDSALSVLEGRGQSQNLFPEPIGPDAKRIGQSAWRQRYLDRAWSNLDAVDQR